MIIHDVEQNSDEWMKLRAGIPTASAFSRLVTSKGAPSKSLTEYGHELAAGKFAEGDIDTWGGNGYTERGHDLEPEAVAHYEFVTENKTEVVGFVTDDKVTMGCSPDRFVRLNGLLEVKCLTAKHHVAALIYHNKHGRAPAGYIQQLQGQMLVCGRQWTDQIFYHPTLPSLIIRTDADMGFQLRLADAIKQVNEVRDAAVNIMEAMV
jgi:hypothetical protein